MSRYHLVLTFPAKNISKLRRLFPESNSISWLYLGEDFFARRDIERKLGSRFKRIDIAKLHDDVVKDIRHEHVRWIDSLNRSYGKHLQWWFGSISSRNIYSSNLFQYCCYLEILERLWVNQNSTPNLIIVESLGLSKAIQKWASKTSIKVKTYYVYCYLAKQMSLSPYLFSFLKWSKFTIILLLRWVAAYISKRKYKTKELKITLPIIVDTYIHDYSLSNGGIFKDKYFPYLHEYLLGKGMHVIVHPVLYGFRFNYLSIYQRMRQSSTHFIIQEDFLHFSDYFVSLIYPLRILLQRIEAVLFLNFDLSDILEEEKRQQSLPLEMQAVLTYRLFLRLGRAGLKPKHIISWYENQVIDRALIAGARQSFPQAKIIGVQGFIHPPNILNLFPSQSEVEAQIVPHLLFETSQHQCQVARAFAKDIPCIPVAALRYSRIFGENIADHNGKQKAQSILMLLSFNIAEAVELLEVLKDGLNQIKEDINILIKGHPDYDSKDLVKAFRIKHWPSRYEIFRGSLQDALKQASLVISSGSSSMIEAASEGIPVIFIGRQTVLNNNILSNLNMDIVTECYSTMELINAINKYLDLSSAKINEYKNMGKKVRELFFTPVNEKTMEPFLNILNNKG